MRLTTLSFLVLIPVFSALAAEPTPPPAQPVVQPPAAAAPEKKVTKEDVAKSITSEATAKDVISGVTEVAAEASKLKSELGSASTGQAKFMIIATLLAAVFKLLLSLIKVLAKNVAWFQSQDGKRVVKYSTLALGALAGLAANIGFGVPLLDCFMIALSGPLSVAVHEYTSDSKPVAPVAKDA